MSITDELRSIVANYPFRDNRDFALFEDIADLIDAKHEKAMSRAGQLLADAEKDRDYNYANWQECKQKVLQGNITIDELNTRIECLEDALLHCIERPKDADGEDIHIGDVMRWLDEDAPNKVDCMHLCGDGWWVFAHGVGVRPKELRHHRAPTVEDVLREFVQEFIDYATCIDDHEVTDAIEQYAKRLKLAGDEE